MKITQRAGWQWQHSRMTQPARAARLWLAVAVAEETMPASTLLDVSDALAHQRRPRRATRLRLVSTLRRGWITIVVALLRQTPLPPGALRPEPWPSVPAIEASQRMSGPEEHYHVAA